VTRFSCKSPHPWFVAWMLCFAKKAFRFCVPSDEWLCTLKSNANSGDRGKKKTAAFLACAKLVLLSILRGTRLARTLRSCGYPLFQCKGTAFYYAPANQYVDVVRSGPKP